VDRRKEKMSTGHHRKHFKKKKKNECGYSSGLADILLPPITSLENLNPSSLILPDLTNKPV